MEDKQGETTRHLVRVSLDVKGLRNNEFYGYIKVKYGGDEGGIGIERFETSPLEVGRVYRSEVGFDNGFFSKEMSVDKEELSKYISDTKMALAIVHLDEANQETTVGMVEVEMASLHEQEYIRSEDSFMRIFDSFHPIMSETDGMIGELRVRLFLEDFGAEGRREGLEKEKEAILANLSKKADQSRMLIGQNESVSMLKQEHSSEHLG